MDRSNIPEPVYDEKPGMVNFYWKAWELAYDHIKKKSGIPQSPYMDEAFSDSDIWIWDTCFMVLFCKYAPDYFPGIQSLKNFYAPLYDGYESSHSIHILDNPPLFAWTELEYYKVTNDRKHLDELIRKHKYLQKHFEWFNTVEPGFKLDDSPCRKEVRLKRVNDGFYWEGTRSGMDNTPRGREGEKAERERPNNPEMLWLDAIAQQGLSALCISRMARELKEDNLSSEYYAEYEKLKNTVNDVYWNSEDGIYYDVHDTTGKHMKCMTPASFWPMLAEMCSEEQASRMAELITDPLIFGGDIPWTNVARNDADFVPETGDYWRGAIWLPTTYMGTKALEKYGYTELANETASRVIEHMYRTFTEFKPATIWECYSPTNPSPAKHGKELVRPDFCGWSALGPISLFIENYLGFYKINAQKNIVEWNKYRKERHGIKRLRFGSIITDIIGNRNKIDVISSAPYILKINGKELNVKKGRNHFDLYETKEKL